MLGKPIIALLAASSAVALAMATPAAADKTADRAREAIAAAEAKIHTAESIGASTDAPRDTAQARAALARDDPKAIRSASRNFVSEGECHDARPRQKVAPRHAHPAPHSIQPHRAILEFLP